MSRANVAGWRLPLGLLAWGGVPVLAGMWRLAHLAAPLDAGHADARFHDSPYPITVHVICAIAFAITGAWQFARGVGKAPQSGHRPVGYVFVGCGLGMAASGLWMTLLYPYADLDGHAVAAMRIVTSIAVVALLLIGIAAIRERNVGRHRAAMLRAYALGMGAATHVLTHLPWLFLPHLFNEYTRAFSMGLGWVINAFVAEYIIWSTIGRKTD